MRYDHFIFDLDGTLMNTSRGVIKSVSRTLKHLERSCADDETLKKFIGPPVEMSFENFIGMTKDEAAHAAEMFRKIYSDKYLYEAEFYEGIESLIDKLKLAGTVSVATYKHESYTRRLLEHFNIYDNFNYVIGYDEKGKKTKTDIIKKCMELSGIAAAKTVMIGDTLHDALSANELGIDFAAVTYGFGFGSEEDLRGISCKAVCRNVYELESFLLKN